MHYRTVLRMAQMGRCPTDSTFSHTTPALREGDFVKAYEQEKPAKPVAKGAGASPGSVFDLTSEEAFRASICRSCGMDLEEEAKPRQVLVMGTVKALSHEMGTAVITVWMRGEEFYTQARPDEKFPIRRLIKVGPPEFAKVCKRPYMRHKQYQLAADADDGQDVALPMSLLTYDAAMASGLFDSLERPGRGKPRRPSQLPPPGEAGADDLQQVARDLGLLSPARASWRRPATAPDPAEDHAPGWAITELTSLPREELSSFARKPTVRKSKVARLLSSMALDTQEAIRASMGKEKSMLQHMHHDSAFQLSNSSLSASRSFARPPEPAADAEIIASVLAVAEEYTVDNILDEGRLRVSSCDVAEPVSFLAVLDGLQFPHSKTMRGSVANLKMRPTMEKLLLGKRISAVPLGCDTRGNVRLNAVLNGRWVQNTVVSLGLARVSDRLVEEASRPQLEPPSANELDEAATAVLLRLQKRAQAEGLGMWQA
eukprot:EG_transcript_8344